MGKIVLVKKQVLAEHEQGYDYTSTLDIKRIANSRRRTTGQLEFPLPKIACAKWNWLDDSDEKVLKSRRCIFNMLLLSPPGQNVPLYFNKFELLCLRMPYARFGWNWPHISGNIVTMSHLCFLGYSFENKTEGSNCGSSCQQI